MHHRLHRPELPEARVRAREQGGDLVGVLRPARLLRRDSRAVALLRHRDQVRRDEDVLAQERCELLAGRGAVERLHRVAEVGLVPEEPRDGLLRVGCVRREADDREPRPHDVLLPEPVHRAAERELTRRDSRVVVVRGDRAVLVGGRRRGFRLAGDQEGDGGRRGDQGRERKRNHTSGRRHRWVLSSDARRSANALRCDPVSARRPRALTSGNRAAAVGGVSRAVRRASPCPVRRRRTSSRARSSRRASRGRSAACS